MTYPLSKNLYPSLLPGLPLKFDGNAKQFRLLNTLSKDGSSLSISIQNCTLQNGGAIGGSGADGLSGGSSTNNANRGAGGGGGLGAGGALFIGPSSIVTMGSNVSLLNNHAQGGKGGDTIIGNRDPSPTFLWGGGGGASFSDTKNTTTVYGGGALLEEVTHLHQTLASVEG